MSKSEPVALSWARMSTAATPADRLARKSISSIAEPSGSETGRAFHVVPLSADQRYANPLPCGITLWSRPAESTWKRPFGVVPSPSLAGTHANALPSNNAHALFELG